MSDAGDDIPVAETTEVEVTTEAPKGKLSIEDALQVNCDFIYCVIIFFLPTVLLKIFHPASPEKRSRTRRAGSRSP